MKRGQGRYYSHLTWQDRLKLNRMHREGRGAQEIADALHVNNSTVYRELKRGLTRQMDYEGRYVDIYCPETAQEKYEQYLAAKGPQLKIGKARDMADYIEDKILNDRYSPVAALKKIEDDGLDFGVTISKWTLYSYIHKGVFLNLEMERLPMHGKTSKGRKKVKRAAKPARGDSIEERPKEIRERVKFGHWEMDTVVSGGRSKARLLVLTERRTRREIIMRIKDGTTKSVVSALNKLERRWGSRRFRAAFKTITVDNGSEFQDCEGMEASCTRKGKRTKIYYCHPYSAYERGSNEVANRMIRRWYPKGTDFAKVTQADVTRGEEWMNTYPRGILGFRTAESLFLECLREEGIA